MNKQVNIEVCETTNNCKITNQYGETIHGVSKIEILPLTPNNFVTAKLTIEGISLKITRAERVEKIREPEFWRGAFILVFVFTIAGYLLR